MRNRKWYSSNLNLSSNVVVNCNDEANFPHKLFLINAPPSRICTSFSNGSSTNKKLSKTQLSKIEHSAGFILDIIDPFEMVPELNGSLESSVKEILISTKNITVKSVKTIKAVKTLL